MRLTRFDVQVEATQTRIANALERIANALELLVELHTVQHDPATGSNHPVYIYPHTHDSYPPTPPRVED